MKNFLLKDTPETKTYLKHLKNLLKEWREENFKLVGKILTEGGIPQDEELLDIILHHRERLLYTCLKNNILDISLVKDISINLSSSVPEDFLVQISKCIQLEKLYIYCYSLLPDEICNISTLQDLTISSSSLYPLPVRLINLPLQSLTFDYCQFENFEQDAELIGQLKSLRMLAFQETNVSTLPTSLVNLHHLEELYLDNNWQIFMEQDTNIEIISQLKKLATLSLSFNNMDALPKEFCDLSNLSSLYLHHNNLKDLPDEIVYLQSLKVLNISGNNFDNIEEEIIQKLSKLKNLETLEVSVYNFAPGTDKSNSETNWARGMERVLKLQKTFPFITANKTHWDGDIPF